MPAMKLMLGAMWAVGGAIGGALLCGLAALVWVKLANVTSREGAAGYFVVAMAMAGALVGLLAGLLLFARHAAPGQGLQQFVQGALGLVVLVAVVAAAIWGSLQLREVPLLYGTAQAQLMLEFRIAAAAAPQQPPGQWMTAEVTTTNTRPEVLLLNDQLRREGEHLIVPGLQGPLIRAGARLVVVRLRLPGGARDEIFKPSMPRTPDPAADWSAWTAPQHLFDAQGQPLKAAPLLELRWRLRLYGR